ncbi:MAG: hypothetical protein DI528_17275 [Shinella sp.]|nr:MAG: hypothetical protein DI528_17275 [Shinella sp.]
MQRGKKRFLLAFAGVLACQPIAAHASALCEQLRDGLTNGGQIIGNSSEFRRYASAIARQNIEIRKTRQDIRRLRCDTSAIVVIRSDGGNDCSDLSSALTRMEENRRDLTSRLEALRNNGPDETTRTRILAALDANGCNDESPVNTEAALPEGQNLDAAGQSSATQEESDSRMTSALDGAAGYGNLRTLCVRTCDGGFFPISSNTSPMNFRRDADTCQQMCPGVETELYYHSMISGESADMVSAQTGRPYRELPTAFSYLNRPTGEKSACECNLGAYYSKMRQSSAAMNVPDYKSAVIEVKPKVPASAPAQKISSTPVERPYDPEDSKIRRVGPSFLAPDQGNLDLRHPAAPGPQPLQ